MKVIWHKTYNHPVPEKHKFPMKKYDLVKKELVTKGIYTSDFLQPHLIEEEWILTSHTKEYWEKLKNLELSAKESRISGFIQDESIVLRERYIMQGAIETALQALNYGVAANIAGGTHHAFSYKGEGFCLLNDLAISANFLLEKRLVKKVLIIDLDVHQGNGTAEIFHNKEVLHNRNIFTFSIHGKNNYPLHKEVSDLDIELNDNTEDNEYISIVREHLEGPLSIIEKFKPDFILFQAGVDVLKSDKFGKLALTKNGCKIRDEIVFLAAEKYQTPISFTLGGGYSPDINDIVEAHINTFILSKEILGS